MIKINIERKDNKIKKIIISGHAGYDVSGKDIVCAAVSSTVITTINNILALSSSIDYKQEKNALTIKVIKDDEITEKLLLSMLSMLKELENDYSKYIKIFKEV